MQTERAKQNSQLADKTLTTLETHGLLIAMSHSSHESKSNYHAKSLHDNPEAHKTTIQARRLIELEAQVRLQQEMLKTIQSESQISSKRFSVSSISTVTAELKGSISTIRHDCESLRRKFSLKIETARAAISDKFVEFLSRESYSKLNRPFQADHVSFQPTVLPLVRDCKRCILESHRTLLVRVSESIKAVCEAYSHRLVTLESQLRTEITLRRKLHNQLIEIRGGIRVFVRVRPLLQDEISRGTKSCVADLADESCLVLESLSGERRQFNLDKVFGTACGNSDLFHELSQLLVSSLDGYNVSILAYGATNSGKTYTMNSIYERIGFELFDAQRQRAFWKYTLSLSVCEVYMDSVVDLINLKNMNVDIRMNVDNGCLHVPGLAKIFLESPADVQRALEEASKHRAVSSTNCNEQSSRSHLITCIYLDIVTPNGRNIESRIHLVDLAGSERLAKSGATGQTAKEAFAINKSLSALADVIHARFNKSTHVPYRNSVLTSVLNESLGGESKTLTIVQISPAQVCPISPCNS